MENLIEKDACYLIIGKCMDVYNELGSGFLEVVYKDALEHEFNQHGISYEREKMYYIRYKGKLLPHKFYADFVVGEKIILEIKCVSKISNECIAQALNYLKISKNRLALIVNFGEKSLVTKRIVL